MKNNIKKHVIRCVSYSLWSVALITFLAAGAVNAQEFIKGFQASSNLVRGTIVSLDKDDTGSVVPTAPGIFEHMHGVIVEPNDSAVTLTEDTSSVFVASSGQYEVLVSSLNGNIKQGDFISGSSISGVGMKIDQQETYVVGQALEDLDFSASSSVLSSTEVSDSGGGTTTVSIGRVLVRIDVKSSPASAAEVSSTPAVLLSVSELVAGKPVSASRIYSATAVLLLSIILAGTLLYASVKSSFTSIGRNPLSKKPIMHSMSQVIFVAITIFVGGFIAVYLILRL